MITLRPRQIVLEAKIKEAYRDLKLKNPNKAAKICVQAPCGFGKTPLMVKMIKRAELKKQQILFLAPKKELINQCSEMLLNNGIIHGVLNNPKRGNSGALVQLSCPETVANRIENFLKPSGIVEFEGMKKELWYPNLIFYDECHGSASTTATTVLEYYEKSDLFGFSATPYRDDLKGLGELYDVLVESCSMKDLIEDGLLIKPEYHVCEAEITTTEAITFNSESDETTTDDADIVINADIIRNFRNICEKAQTVVFCSSIDKADEVAEKFRKAGFTAKSVDSKKTKDKVRDQILKDFDDKKFQILCNAVLLKEGWDCPDLECVIILRKLQSRIFYRQSAARCMRTSKNKPNKKAYILDFFNNVEKFDLPWEDEIYSLTETVQSDPSDKELEKKSDKPSFCDKPGCLTMLDPGITVCPVCGTSKLRGEKLVVEAVADLKKVDESKLVTKSDKQIEYDKYCALCMDKKWKPKSVDAKYKQKFGVWPRGMVQSPNFKKYCDEYKRAEINMKINMQQEFSDTQFTT